jgi:hypothetical protein
MNACAWIISDRRILTYGGHLAYSQKGASHEPAFFDMVVVLSFLVVATDGPSLLRGGQSGTLQQEDSAVRQGCLLLSLVSNLNPCQPSTPDLLLRSLPLLPAALRHRH